MSDLIHLHYKVSGMTSSVQLSMHSFPSERIVQKNIQSAWPLMMPWIGIPRFVFDHKIQPLWYLTTNLQWQLLAGYTSLCKRAHCQKQHVAA